MDRAALSSLVERYLDALAAICVGALVFYFGDFLSSQFAKSGAWSLAALYAGILNWASIECGFMFAAYTFAAASSNDFMRAVAKTPSFIAFKAMMLQLVYVSLLVAAAALVMSVIDFYPTEIWWSRLIFAAWFSLIAFSMLRFLTVLRIFRIIAHTELR